MNNTGPCAPSSNHSAPDFTLASWANTPVTLSEACAASNIQYGLLHLERFFSNRAYFLIDKSGVIRWTHVEETPSQRRENAEILAEIAKLS